MTRQSTITQAEAYDAIEALLKDGQYPTGARLRQQLGDRGSPVVLQRYLGGWYEDFGPAFAGEVEATRPSNMRDQLHALTKEAMDELDRLQQQAQEELEAQRSALDAREQALAKAEHELVLRETAHHDYMAELKVRLEEAVAQRSAAVDEADKCREHNRVLASKIERAETDLTRLAQESAELEAKLDQARSDIVERTRLLERARTDREHALAGSQTLSKDLQAAKEQLASILDAARERDALLNSQIGALQAENRAYQEKITRIEHDQAERDLAHAQALERERELGEKLAEVNALRTAMDEDDAALKQLAAAWESTLQEIRSERSGTRDVQEMVANLQREVEENVKLAKAIKAIAEKGRRN